jgi:hypothetical protein
VPRGEASLSDLRIRPDYAIEIDHAICGHLEVKAPGKGANPAAWKPKSHDARQWEKLKLLPNVLYVDGNEWALYRNGVRIGNLVRLRGDVRTSGSRLAPPDSELGRILAAFLRWSPTPPRTLNQLVQSVAGLCRLLREEVTEALVREQESTQATPFTHLAADWRELLSRRQPTPSSPMATPRPSLSPCCLPASSESASLAARWGRSPGCLVRSTR